MGGVLRTDGDSRLLDARRHARRARKDHGVGAKLRHREDDGRSLHPLQSVELLRSDPLLNAGNRVVAAHSDALLHDPQRQGGSQITALPDWVELWGNVGMLTINDLNSDGILQYAELSINRDIVVLATPEIAGLPYVIAGLVAAGGLAAALSDCRWALARHRQRLQPRCVLSHGEPEGGRGDEAHRRACAVGGHRLRRRNVGSHQACRHLIHGRCQPADESTFHGDATLHRRAARAAW